MKVINPAGRIPKGTGAMRRPASRSLGVLLFVSVFLVCDFGAAQLLRRFFPAWNFQERGVLERKYRIESPLYHHDLAPNADVTSAWGNVPYHLITNSLGFRDATVREVPLQGRRRRVVFIGDSFTEGIGVPYDSTFVGRLARAWQPHDVEVLNAAVAGYSPAMYYRKIKDLLEERGLKVQGIVVCIDISDIYNEAVQYRLNESDRVEELIPPEPSGLGTVKEVLKDNSVLLHVVDAAKDIAGGRKRYALDERIARWTLSDELMASYGRVGLARAGENMERLLIVARRHHIPVAIVVYPWPDQIVEKDLNSRQVSFWGEWAKRTGSVFINLFPAFIGAGDAQETITDNFIAYDYHWNATGHGKVAEGLLKADLLGRLLPATSAQAAGRP